MRFPLSPTAFLAAFSLPLFLCFPAFAANSPEQASPPAQQVMIPGPLRSFLRMAGISQKVPPEDVLPELARNVYTQGYSRGRETEFLLLLEHYVHQARELQALASSNNGEIRVAHCADAGPLLQILGYRLRYGCGQKDAALVTLNPDSAFLTIDSGFPLTRLEEALISDTPFVYPFTPSMVPVLFKRSDWVNLIAGKKSGNEDMVDVILHDPHVARLYWAMSKMDPETGQALQKAVGLWSLLPYAGVLDFYGTEISIRNHKVIVPGGKPAESGWSELVGA